MHGGLDELWHLYFFFGQIGQKECKRLLYFIDYSNSWRRSGTFDGKSTAKPPPPRHSRA